MQLQAPYAVWKLLDYGYGALGNKLLMRLTRYLYLYFYGAFWSVIDNEELQKKTSLQLQQAMVLCSEGEWNALPEVLRVVQDELSSALRTFYEKRITLQYDGEEIAFSWDAYEKSAQLRNSLAMELLVEIGHGEYPVGSYLPTAARLSAEKNVSVSTVRRAIGLLNSIGAVKSARTLGARVLPPSQSAENCDFTQPDLRRRLLEVAESLQIFALSVRAVSEVTLTSLDGASLGKWKQFLLDFKERGRCERLIYASLVLISEYAPFQALRTVYSELLRLLFWGNPLQTMLGVSESGNLFFAPYFERILHSLDRRDIRCFSSTLEFLVFHELQRTVKVLTQLRIQGAENILIPDVYDLGAVEVNIPDNHLTV